MEEYFELQMCLEVDLLLSSHVKTVDILNGPLSSVNEHTSAVKF